MNDPLRDPRFPNRPQHPDFWRLSETAMALDGKTAESGASVSDVASPDIDVESLFYAAESRVNLMLQATGLKVPDSVQGAMVAIYISALVHGIEFQKAGGHRG